MILSQNVRITKEGMVHSESFESAHFGRSFSVKNSAS